MAHDATISPRPFKALGLKHFQDIAPLRRLDADRRLDIEAVAHVLPFRTNPYVVEELIDWDRVPDDPMFQLTFPQEGMLEPRELRRLRDLLHRRADRAEIDRTVRSIRTRMNPHPAGQMQLNVPQFEGEPVPGVQHKYRETVLFFPKAGQTCHAYCTYCFRWPQFVGDDDLAFASKDVEVLVKYLRSRPQITDVLFTGGDPMIMRTAVLRRYVEPLLQIESVRTIRFGTKATAYWPYRFVTDRDADDLMRLFEEVVESGRHLALMSHYSHPVELSTEVSRVALRRILRTGAVVRCQSPIVRHVNDDAESWASLWQTEVEHGAVPYYMFVERDTGPKRYFEVPLGRALEVFQKAYQRVSGLARTVRGPSMSATPGKVLVDGVAKVGGQKVFVLKMIQGRDPQWTERVFFAHYDPQATWLDELRPALDGASFFFEDKMKAFRGREVVDLPDAADLRLAAGADTNDAASMFRRADPAGTADPRA